MRIIDRDSRATAPAPTTGNVVFEDRRELRQFVLEQTKKVIAAAREKLPPHVRWLVSVDRLNAAVEWAFARVWPYHGDIPA